MYSSIYSFIYPSIHKFNQKAQCFADYKWSLFYMLLKLLGKAYILEEKV